MYRQIKSRKSAGNKSIREIVISWWDGTHTYLIQYMHMDLKREYPAMISWRNERGVEQEAEHEKGLWEPS